jgi:hypothetical protein
MTGLSDTYSTNIVCDTIDIANELTVEPGGIVTLPPGSIQDSYVSSNVAFRNQVNNFTLANNFASITNFNALSIGNATYRNFQSIQAVFPADFRMLDSTQTRLTQLYQFGNTCSIDGNFPSSKLQFTTRDALSNSINNLVMESGTCYLQAASGLGIGLVGSAISIDGICSFTNPTTPVITQPISLLDNSTKIPTTAFVKGQNYITTSALTPYALLNPSSTQTFAGTGVQSFSNTAVFSNGLNSYSNITLYSGAFNTTIRQNTLGLEITNVDLSKYIQLITRTSGGGNTIGVSCENGNSAYIQGDSGAQISITNQQANIGGSSPPTISTNPLNSDSSNKIASTSFVKNQGYASLDPSALQIWGTNQNQFNTQVNMNSTPIRFVDGFFSSQISQSGNALIIKNVSNINSVQIRSTTSGLIERTGVTVQNGNETIIQGGSAGIIRILGNNATIESSTFTSNAPYTCGYNSLGTLPTKSNQDIGYVWSIAGTSFTAWSGFITPNNVVTIAWDGSGDKTIGIWKVDISLTTNSSTTINTNLNWNMSSTTSMTPNFTCANSVGVTTHGAVSCNILRLSFTLDVTNLTSTYYLNFLRASGSALSDNTAASRIQFTRIA